METKVIAGVILLSQNFAGGNEGETAEFRRQVPPNLILALRQAVGHPIYGGMWVVSPAGHVEVDTGETQLQAAKREAREEVNAHVLIRDMQLFFRKTFNTGKNIRILHYYLALRWNLHKGGLAFGDMEIMAHDWLSAEEALEKELIMLYPDVVRKLVAEGHLQ